MANVQYSDDWLIQVTDYRKRNPIDALSPAIEQLPYLYGKEFILPRKATPRRELCQGSDCTEQSCSPASCAIWI